MTDRHNRQAELVPERVFDVPITVIGAGGIGSFTTLALAKCGFKDITVYDDDKVEEHNIPNQFYPLKAIGTEKVIALQAMIAEWEGIGIKIRGRYPDERYRDKGIIIAAVDNMETRKLIYERNCRNTAVVAIIDGRMGGNQLEVYTCRINDRGDKKAYKSVLWTDEETTQIPCTQRAVIYNVLTIASWIVNQTRLVLSNKEYKRLLILDLESMSMIG